MAFPPPPLTSIQHVVINSAADKELGLRTGMSSTVIPNVRDIDHPPVLPDGYARNVRKALQRDDDLSLVLQPARARGGKRKPSGLIEDSIACWLR